MSKNKRKGFKWWIFLLLGGFVLELAALLSGSFRRKEKDVEKNFKKFIKKEKDEIDKLKSGKEKFDDYIADSAGIFKKYFIPCEENGHKPKILHSHSLAAIIFIMAVLKLSVTVYLFFIYPNQGRMTETMISQMLELTNKDRQASGITGLNLDPALSAAALQKAQDMIKNNYFSHYGPDGKKPWSWISRDAYPYLFVGENLAMNFSTANSAQTALMNSPTHKKNILNDKYKDIGLAVVRGVINGEETNVLVELFAARQSAPLVISDIPQTQAGTTPKVTQASTAPAKTAPATTAPAIKTAPATIAKTPTKTVTQPTTAKAATPAEIKPVASIASTTSAVEPIAIAATSSNEMASAKENLSVIDLSNLVGTSSSPIVAGQSSVISPNADMEYRPAPTVQVVPAASERKVAVGEMLIAMSKYIFVFTLAILGITLILNVFIRFKVQHKAVIFETLIVMLVIAGMLSFRFHELETFIEQVAIL